MQNPYELLGVSPQASSAEVKAAYHARLRNYPAHSHPLEFQQIRDAYERIRAADVHRGDPLQPGPLLAQLDAEQVAAIEADLQNSARLSLHDLIRLSF
jgi:hypothetical protein